MEWHVDEPDRQILYRERTRVSTSALHVPAGSKGSAGPRPLDRRRHRRSRSAGVPPAVGTAGGARARSGEPSYNGAVMPADDGPLIDGLRRDLRQEDGPPRSTRAWDVAVVGAGPAGSTLAAHLASRGRHVLLLDRDRFPREKVCGDGLIPDALAALGRLGLAEEVAAAGYRSSRVTIWSPSRLAVDLPGTFVTLKRLVLDALIARAAVRRGAAFAHGRVVALEYSEPGEVRLRPGGTGKPGARARRSGGDRCRSVAVPAAARTGDRLGPDGDRAAGYVKSRARIDGLQVSFDRRVLPGTPGSSRSETASTTSGAALFRGTGRHNGWTCAGRSRGSRPASRRPPG